MVKTRDPQMVLLKRGGGQRHFRKFINCRHFGRLLGGSGRTCQEQRLSKVCTVQFASNMCRFISTYFHLASSFLRGVCMKSEMFRGTEIHLTDFNFLNSIYSTYMCTLLYITITVSQVGYAYARQISSQYIYTQNLNWSTIQRRELLLWFCETVDHN